MERSQGFMSDSVTCDGWETANMIQLAWTLPFGGHESTHFGDLNVFNDFMLFTPRMHSNYMILGNFMVSGFLKRLNLFGKYLTPYEETCCFFHQ